MSAFIILLYPFCLFSLFKYYSLSSLFSNHSFLISLTFLMIPMLLSQLFFRPPTWYVFTRAYYHYTLLVVVTIIIIIVVVVDVFSSFETLKVKGLFCVCCYHKKRVEQKRWFTYFYFMYLFLWNAELFFIMLMEWKMRNPFWKIVFLAKKIN